MALRSLSATAEESVVTPPTVGVVGALLPTTVLTELLEEATAEVGEGDVVYLVDSSGYVVASTDQVEFWL